ncbi:MAG: polyphosphate kinase 1, partial [Spirochaetales bacterium]|nr:polyphosphate kinase 1 [Spirochaetales bacterium]
MAKTANSKNNSKEKAKENMLFNRELSWLEFDYRVLEEGLDPQNRLLERLKFLSIFSNNLDEFFMVRVAGLLSQQKAGYQNKDACGMTPDEVLAQIAKRLRELLKIQYDCFNNVIMPELNKNQIYLYMADDIPEKYEPQLKQIFLNKYFMILTPMAVDQSHPFPFIAGKTLNLLVKIEEPKKHEHRFAIIPCPAKDFFVKIEDKDEAARFVYVGELVKKYAHHFFKGYKVLESAVFRITRDAELSIDEEGAEDLLAEIEGQLRKREKGAPVRLEIEASASDDIKNFLRNNIKCNKEFVFEADGPVDMTGLMQIACMSGYDNLKDEPMPPISHADFTDKDQSIFDIISRRDRILYHPFESFDPVVRFIDEASSDDKVLAIKMTLYRTSGESPIIKALKKAAQNNKQVTVLVELKARFDEAQNIGWAKQLEKEGCHVVYGLVGLKTHCKVALVVRDEEDGIKRYIHLSTGNYNDKTAKLYTDLGLFTCRKSFGRDITGIFNLLTGYSEPPRWQKLICAPLDMRNFFIEKIGIEKQNAINGGKGKIVAKMNALIDTKIIMELYEASKAGVEIDLMVCGMCCLVPGVPGLSENIRVYSIVGRYLEHS